MRRAGAVLAAVVALDQASKAIVNASIERGRRVEVLPLLDLVNVRNRGVAFGFLAGDGGLALALVATALVVLVAWSALDGRRPLVWLPTGLLLGGAIGNLVDRVRVDAVVDWIKVSHWPAFNLADSAITLGVVSLLVVLERGHARDPA